MEKKKFFGTALACGTLFTSLFFLQAKTTQAVAYDQAKVETSISLQGGGITFFNGAPIGFEQKTISAQAEQVTSSVLNPILTTSGGVGSLKVNDLRGGSTGWYISCYSTKMKNNANAEYLPITSYELNIQDETTDTSGVTDPAVEGNGGYVDYFANVEPSSDWNNSATSKVLCVGLPTSNGLHTTGPVQARLSYGRTDTLQYGVFRGEIHFNLIDGQPESTP